VAQLETPHEHTEIRLNFIHDNFLLHSKTARRLYEDYAASQPIIDYHSHLPPADIAQNRRYQNLFEIALEGDHYKWRAMRANGIAERYCTGDASPEEKFMAWVRTVPYTLRNPLYQWTHLELQRYFGIDELLNESTAQDIWKRGNSLLAISSNRKRRKSGFSYVPDFPTRPVSSGYRSSRFQCVDLKTASRQQYRHIQLRSVPKRIGNLP
jgi:hypothetical protein